MRRNGYGGVKFAGPEARAERRSPDNSATPVEQRRKVAAQVARHLEGIVKSLTQADAGDKAAVNTKGIPALLAAKRLYQRF